MATRRVGVRSMRPSCSFVTVAIILVERRNENRQSALLAVGVL
jgi:hypothetical protein